MAVVAALQVDANFLSDKHLKTVHSLTSLGNVQLIVIVAHNDFSPSFRLPERRYFPAEMYLFLSVTLV